MAFVSIGILTFGYVMVELGVALYLKSLVLLSDGFHNLSDVISLGIAYWAQQAQKRDSNEAYTYGYQRAEILGGLTNGCFLISLCMYVILASIPKFIIPDPIEEGLLFIIVAAAGLGVNTIGTIVFAISGNAHAHSHGGGGGHGHSHGGEKKEKKEKKDEGEDNGNSQKKKKEKKRKKRRRRSWTFTQREKRQKKKKKKAKIMDIRTKRKKIKKTKRKVADMDMHMEETKKRKKKPKDVNTHAVFLHYLGDAVSSLLVLLSGALLHFFPYGKVHGENSWTLYIDPVSSLVIVGLILWTTIPLVLDCSKLLMQSTPSDCDIGELKHKLSKVEGLLHFHDFHVWTLVHELNVASIHVSVEEGCDFEVVYADIKKIFHKQNVHSVSITPHFVSRNTPESRFCPQICTKDCKENWCCKKTADRYNALMADFNLANVL